MNSREIKRRRKRKEECDLGLEMTKGLLGYWRKVTGLRAKVLGLNMGS